MSKSRLKVTKGSLKTQTGVDAYSVHDVASRLGISQGLAYMLVHQGTIPSLRLRGRLIVPRVQFEAFLNGAIGSTADGE